MDSPTQPSHAGIVFLKELKDLTLPFGEVRVLGRITEIFPELILEHEGEKVRLTVELLNQSFEELRIGSIYQVIGTLFKDQNGCLFIRARIIRNVDGIDTYLWKNTIELLRDFQNKNT